MRPRLKLSYLFVAALLLVGVAPLFFYATRVIALNRDALRTKEQEFQTATTRALADEAGLYYRMGGVALSHLGAAVVVVANGDVSGDRVNLPEIRGLLTEALDKSPQLLYVSIVNDQTQGVTASRLPGLDPFLSRAMERAYLVSRAGQDTYVPVEIAAREAAPGAAGDTRRARVVMLRSQPLRAGGAVIGVILQVESFQPIQARLDETTAGGLECYLVDERGHLIAAGAAPGATQSAILGQDLSHLEIVRRLLSWRGNPGASETTAYDQPGPGGPRPVLATYSGIPDLHWAVVAQRPQSLAFAAAHQLARESYLLLVAILIISVELGILFSGRLTRPLRLLRDQAQALARREFLGRVAVRSRTEIGDLARNFNSMAEEIERFVAELKVAAAKNRELFLGSIRLLAQAVDMKDPYTRGHSDRVTRYSVAIARRLNLTEDEVETVRIAAQLHDVGKIGIDDRVLKKPGALSSEEFALMKQHTVKGAEIVRQVEQLRHVIPGVELHHEAVNGGGYPYGLLDEEIPLMAKIIAVADTFDAMTTERPYQAARELQDVVPFIASAAGTRYSPAVVAAFVAAVEAGEIQPRRATRPETSAAGASPSPAFAAVSAAAPGAELPGAE